MVERTREIGIMTINEQRAEIGLGPLNDPPRAPYADIPIPGEGRHPLELMDFYLDGVAVEATDIIYDRNLNSIRLQLGTCPYTRSLTIYHKRYRYSSNGIDYKKYIYPVNGRLEEIVFGVETLISGSPDFLQEYPAEFPEQPTEGSEFEL